MKKIFTAILSMALVICTVCSLTACSSKSFTVYTGGKGGAYFGFTNALAPMLNKKTGYTFNVIGDTGGSVANIKAINNGDAKLAIVQNDTMINAYNGLSKNFESGAIKSFSVVAQVYPEVMQIITNKDITSLADLKNYVSNNSGRKFNVSIGDVGSGVEANAVALLQKYDVNITYDSASKKYVSTEINIHNLSVDLSASGMQSSTIDVFFFTSGAPATAIQQLAANGNQIGAKMLSLDDTVMNDFISDNKIDGKYDVYSVVEVTNAQYSFISATKSVKTIGVTATYIASNDVSEDDIYKITKAIWDSKTDMISAYAIASTMDIQKAFVAIGNVPVHKGAAKYYTEKGLTVNNIAE